MSLLNIKLICCVKDCKNQETETTALFMFPEDTVDELQWKVILNIDKPISKFFRVCSDHFQESDFIEENSMIKVLKPGSFPSKNIPCDENKTTPKRVYINKCGICNEIINKKRYAFGLKSAGSLATRNKWIKILGGKKYIKAKTSICYIHFKPSDFLPKVSGTTRRTLRKNVIPTLYLNGELPEEIEIIPRSSTRLKKGKKKTFFYDETIKAEPGIGDNLNIRRYNFGTAIQLKDDSLDDFFYRLEILAKDCDYNDMKNDLIRDRFIIGINDAKLREKLLHFENLTLNSLIAIANITIKKEIEFVTVIDEQPEMYELMTEIKCEENQNQESQNLPEKVKEPITIRMSSSIKPLEPLFNKKCFKCNETFRSPNYLFQHILQMHSLKFLCKICKAKFHSSEDLMLHVNIYHKPSHTTAETTDKKPTHIPDPVDCYSSDNSCLPAKETYTYPYMCELCAKIIKNSGQLALHKMEHQGIKPYLCTVCGLGFRVPYALKKHEMVHTGEKPFSCGICTKRFARNYHLKSHMWRIHKVEKAKVERKLKKSSFKTATSNDVTIDINFDVGFDTVEDN